MFNKFLHFINALGLVVFYNYQASAAQQEVTLFSAKAIYVEYNRSGLRTKKADQTSRLKVKDAQSGSTVLINLQPQITNSKIWYGYFSIQFLKGDESSKAIEFFDSSGKKLFVFVESTSPIMTLSLFQNRKNWATYVEKFKTAKTPPPEIAKALAPAPVAPPNVQQTPINDPEAREKEIKAQQAQVRLNEQQQEQMRLSMEETLALKREELRKIQEALSNKEKEQRNKEAASAADEASKAYKNGDYQKASDFYEKSSDLDPANEKLYYQYGVSLYKVGNYNKSLAILSLAEDPEVNQIEKSYYTALNHMKLKEYPKALEGMIDIRSENDPELSAMASFFAGNIEFQTQKYADARKSFEYVIDNSKDPKMDKSAEDMLEQIDRIENFIASSKERFRYTFTIGTIYDSDVLNMSANNFPTDLNAFRLNYGLSLMTHIWRDVANDFMVQVSGNDYASVDKGFQKSATLSAVDPSTLAIEFPYKVQFQASGKGYNLGLTPSYTSTFMAPTGGAKKEILATSALSTDLTTTLRSDIIARFKFDYSADRPYLTPATPDDDQTAKKFAITYYQTQLLDLKGSSTWGGEISYTNNNTVGINNKYNKFGAGLNRGFPISKEISGSLKLDYSTQKYLETLAARTDNVLALTGSAMKTINKQMNFMLNGTISTSHSDLPTYTYDKFMISAILTHSTAILDK